MLGRGVGLVELVEAARERALARDDIVRWHLDECGWGDDEAEDARSAAAGLADEVCRLLLGGQFQWAANVALPYDLYVPADLWDNVYLLDECPAWKAFNEVIKLAARIDSFLGVMEADRRTAALASDCRRELDLLGVLADLCEDVGLPRAAGEARHLHSLADAAWGG